MDAIVDSLVILKSLVIVNSDIMIYYALCYCQHPSLYQLVYRRKYQYIQPIDISSINLDLLLETAILSYLNKQYIIVSEFVIMR